MKVDLLHNKIIKDTVTPSFVLSFNENLIPKLTEKYGDSLTEVRMYEDHLRDGFAVGGEFHYPLTLTVAGEFVTEWIKWNVSAKKLYENQVPYAYIGSMPLSFELCDSVPEELSDKLSANYIYEDSAPLIIQSASPDKTFLSGKYSQSFVDIMASEISRKIEKMFSISGIRESGVELMLVFAPGTYMEHIADNVTYRRLLITARACSARDLWIKWTNLKGAEPLSVSNDITPDDVSFELGEDVPQKIREKEYRFLVRTSADKYQFAMGRKNITEWRDLIKRVIKRGEVTLVEMPVEEKPIIAPEEPVYSEPAAPVITPEPELKEAHDDDLASRLSEMLADYKTEDAVEEPVTEDGEDATDLSALLKNVLGVTEEEEPVEPSPEPVIEELITDTAEEELVEEEPESEEPAVEEPAVKEPEAAPAFDRTLYEDELRRRIEAEIREKFEAEARAKLEAEAEALRREQEALKAENERLAAIAKQQEEERLAKEAARQEEAERLRRELEAKERAEARERERIQEAARAALVEQQRIAEERKLEEERMRAEEQRRAEAEAKLLEERRIAEEKKKELEARAAEEAKAAASASQINYISKNARLIFRRPIDPNVTKRIHEIILTTIKYYHKEDVYIKIKATVPDSTTVNLNFVKIPESETELLINIIKVLGKSELGIVKVFLE